MAQFNWTIDGKNYGEPEGWDSVEALYTFEDSKSIFTRYGTELTWCSQALFDLVLDAKQTDPCKVLSVILTYQCEGDPGPTILDTLEIPVKEAALDCDRCAVDLSLIDVSILECLDSAKSDSLVIAPTGTLTMRQYESGVLYGPQNGFPNNRANTINVFDLIQAIADRVKPGSFLLSDIIGPSAPEYSPHVFDITFPAGLAGDVFTLEVDSVFGDNHAYTVNVPAGGYTGAVIAELMSRVELYQNVTTTGFFPELPLREMLRRIGKATVAGDVLTQTTYWEATRVELFINGAPAAGAAVETQAYQYSLKRLHLSTDGMQANSFEMTYSDVVDFISSICPIVSTEAVANDFNINTYNTIANQAVIDADAAPAAPRVGVDTIKFQSLKVECNKEWFINSVVLGQEFEIEKYTESLENWKMLGNSINMDPTGITTSSQTGVYSIQGEITVTNASAGPISPAISIYQYTPPGPPVANDIVGVINVTLLGGETKTFNVTLFGDSSSPLPTAECVTLNDEWTFTADNPNLVFTPSGPTVNYIHSCYPEPQVDERTAPPETIDTNLEAFATCPGSKNLRINKSFYTGTGFAVSQLIEGFAEYKDTKFAIFGDTPGDPANPSTTAEPFEYSFFFDRSASTCVCLQETFQNFVLFNVPLQHPWIQECWRSRIPSDLDVESYNFTASVDVSGNFTRLHAQQRSTLPAIQTRKMVATLETCETLTDHVLRTGQKAMQIEVCGEKITGLILESGYKFNNSVGQIKVEYGTDVLPPPSYDPSFAESLSCGLVLTNTTPGLVPANIANIEYIIRDQATMGVIDTLNTGPGGAPIEWLPYYYYASSTTYGPTVEIDMIVTLTDTSTHQIAAPGVNVIPKRPPLWTNKVNVTETPPANLVNTVAGWGNAGAFSTYGSPTVGSTDFWVEFTSFAGTTMCGVSYTDTNQNYTSINYAIWINPAGGTFNVYELGVFRYAGGPGAFTAGDTLRVERVGTTISLYINGVAIPHPALAASSGKMYLDSSFNTLNSQIDNPHVSWGPC